MSDAISKSTISNHLVSLKMKEEEHIVENLVAKEKTINDINKKIISSYSIKRNESLSGPILRPPEKLEGENINIGIKPEVEDFSQNNMRKIKRSSQEKKQQNNFLDLQLKYQGIINDSILNTIKNTDRFEEYLHQFDDLEKQISGLVEDYKSILDDVKKYQETNVDYWMEVYHSIQEKGLKTEDEVCKFLNNKKISKDIINDLIHKKFNRKSEMADYLIGKFPSLNIPKDISKNNLYDLDDLHGNILDFFKEISNIAPHVSMSDEKLKSISVNFYHLKNIIDNKSDDLLTEKIQSAKKAYIDLTLIQSHIELEIASRSLSGMALLTFLLAKVRELTMKVMLQRSENEQKLFEEMQKVTEKSLRDKIDDQNAKIKKQEEIQYWAGIGLKILGGLLAIFAGIAAVFTAGASLALMAVAVTLLVADVALTAADEIYQAIHGESFMDEIMAPISEAIMKVIDKIVDVLMDMFESFLDTLKELGLIDKINDIKKALYDKIKMAFKILVTIVLFVAAIALTFVAGPAINGITNVAKKIFNEQIKQTLKKVLNDYLEKMLGNMIKEIIMQAIEEVLKAINKAITKITDNILLQKITTALNKISHMITEDISEKAINTIHRTAVGAKLLNSVASSTINIYSNTISADIMRSVADSKKLIAILDLVQKLMDKIMEEYNDNMDTITEILKNMSDSYSVSSKVKSNIAKSISA
ncbi:type III secretion system translocon subunit SctE [Proteus vulgaris]|uniref:type III secretion system translocon subunit SctE n=1 Tax=Proteus vulgaris TaxID=585 RepID=UPI0018E44D07|nr:type III secretion system translocon subunit SctE [Proteus vulgaris]MBI6528176.1 type III secretion system translocon subunit SctE [Proteus vulgaris]